MIKKLIVLGMDGLDIDVIEKYKDRLPNLYASLEHNGMPKMNSVFPADTTPAWSTVYLGVDPSCHGVVNFINMADKDNGYAPLVFDDSVFHGKCFWDKMNESGLSVGVVLPMNIKIGWEINGIMITRPYEGKIRVYPENKRDVYKPKEKLLATDAKFTSEKKLGKLEKLFFDKADEEIRLTKEIAKGEELDVLFSYLSTPDGIQHDFWSYCDEKHKDFVEGNPFIESIPTLYEKMDRLVKDMRDEYPNVPMLVISDHGHGARPVKTIRLNEVLRREGYLVPKSKNPSKKKKKGSFKSFLFRMVRKIGLSKGMVKLLKRFPVWKKLLAPSDFIDWDNTIAYLSDLSAVKNYSYGGIRLTEKYASDDAVKDEIISKLVKYEVDGHPLFTWIRKTNDFYHGQYLNKYPEIIFQMDEKYGAGWDLGDELFVDDGSTHVISPGGHRYATATIGTFNYQLEKAQWDLVEMRSLIMKMAGVQDE